MQPLNTVFFYSIHECNPAGKRIADPADSIDVRRANGDACAHARQRNQRSRTKSAPGFALQAYPDTPDRMLYVVGYAERFAPYIRLGI